MPAAPRHPRSAQEGRRPQSSAAVTPQKKAGRPPGAPSTIVNLRMPVDLLAELDRYIDRLEGQTGLKANRGMIVRRAVALFLETRASGTSVPSL
jgi:hypothetical protein